MVTRPTSPKRIFHFEWQAPAVGVLIFIGCIKNLPFYHTVAWRRGRTWRLWRFEFNLARQTIVRVPLLLAEASNLAAARPRSMPMKQ
jgi:hypothetical protein